MDTKVVEQLLAVQLAETANHEREILADVLKLSVDVELVTVGAVVFPGCGILLVIHVLWRGLLSTRVLRSRLWETNKVLITELCINQVLIGVEEVRNVTKTRLVACSWIAQIVQASVNPLLFPSPSAGCPATSLARGPSGRSRRRI